jgi:mRNA-degrading endonuclease RelE of RelBE toxin-antitoxin system
LAYRLRFADEVDDHLKALTSRQKAKGLDAIERHLLHEPKRPTRNRKPMDPDKKGFIAPWELRIGELRVYYAVEEEPEATVAIVAVGIKVRERLRIGGKDIVP